MIRQIPNTLTLLNLVCGFAATVYALKGYNEYASFCIMAGMLLDFSDGFAASATIAANAGRPRQHKIEPETPAAGTAAGHHRS